jgi:hypothetical protein
MTQIGLGLGLKRGVLLRLLILLGLEVESILPRIIFLLAYMGAFDGTI